MVESICEQIFNYIAQAGEMATLYMHVQSPRLLFFPQVYSLQADFEECSLLHSLFGTHYC